MASSIMTTTTSNLLPIVVHPVELADFIQFILEIHTSPSTLIVCGSLDDFLKALINDIDTQRHPFQPEGDDEERMESSSRNPINTQFPSVTHPLLTPTLHQISLAQTLKLTFCSNLESLHAFLGTYGLREIDSSSHFEEYDDMAKQSTYTIGGHKVLRHPVLVLLNIISIHRGTSSFSAQGLGRTIASSVEAAHRFNQRLIIVECISQVPVIQSLDLRIDNNDMEEEAEHIVDNPWEQQIPILNITTKNFRPGDSGWVGRTVTIRMVAERWCTFVTPNDAHILSL